MYQQAMKYGLETISDTVTAIELSEKGRVVGSRFDFDELAGLPLVVLEPSKDLIDLVASLLARFPPTAAFAQKNAVDPKGWMHLLFEAILNAKPSGAPFQCNSSQVPINTHRDR